MATKRYYKATDGKITAFRATERTYRSASFDRYHRGGLSFSGATAYGAYQFPAVEITKREYTHLIALKQQRLLEAGKSIAYNSAPNDSWITNEALAACPTAAIVEDATPTPRGWACVEAGQEEGE